MAKNVSRYAAEFLFLLQPTLRSISIGTAHALADFTGPVVSVLDGDALEVLNGHHDDRVRLSGIDCPEKGQAYGKRAK